MPIVACHLRDCIANRQLICTRQRIELLYDDLFDLRCVEYKQKTKETHCAICGLKDSISCDGCKNFDMFEFKSQNRNKEGDL